MLFNEYISGRYPKQEKLDQLDVILRCLQSDDGERLMAFFRAVPEKDRLFLADDVTDPAVIRRWCAERNFDLVFPLLAVVRDEIIADATLHRDRGGWKQHIGRIRVVVHPEYQGRGIARLLVTELAAIAVEIGLDKLDGEFMSGQDGQMAAFEKMGFVRTAVLPDHVLDRQNGMHDLVVMTYDLRGEVFAID